MPLKISSHLGPEMFSLDGCPLRGMSSRATNQLASPSESERERDREMERTRQTKMGTDKWTDRQRAREEERAPSWSHDSQLFVVTCQQVLVELVKMAVGSRLVWPMVFLSFFMAAFGTASSTAQVPLLMWSTHG